MREALFQRLIQADKPFLRVAGSCWIDLYHKAALPLKAELLVLQVDKAFGEQSGNCEQRQRKRGLHHHERFLSFACGAACGAC